MQEETKNTSKEANLKTDFVVKKIESPVVANPPLENNSSPFKIFVLQNRLYLWMIFIGVAIIGVLSYFAFRKVPAAPVKEAKISLQITAPETAPSGGEAIFQINIENQDTQRLVDIQLELTYAPGMSYENSNAPKANFSGTLFKIPDLVKGQNAAVILKTKVLGQVNESKNLTAKLSYKYSNFNSIFSTNNSATVKLIASNTFFEISAPTEVNNSSLFSLKINYKNNSDQDIKGVRIQLSYPQGFDFSTANPLPNLGNDIWSVGNLAKGGSGEIEIQGFLKDSNPGELKGFSAKFLVLGDSGDYQIQNQASASVSIATTPLLVSQSLSNSSQEPVLKPGDSLDIEIRYQNNTSVVANGVNIVCVLDSKVLDLQTLRSEGGQISGNVIVWNASAMKNLESLAPGESGKVSFSVTVKKPAVKDSSTNLTVVSSVKIKSKEYDNFFPGNTLNFKISSPVSFAKKLGFVSGSLPPQVGKQTIYKVSLSVFNSSNDMTDPVLTAFLPGAFGSFVSESVNSAEASRVDFDSATGKLTWNLGKLNAYAGKFSQPRTLEFGLNFLPAASDSGQTPTLVKNISFVATDSFTSQQVSESLEDVKTDDLPGEDGYSKGQVQP